MVEGDSGILARANPRFKPVYQPSKRRLTWPNGAIATVYSADKPDRLRGPQHDLIWGDEAAVWRYGPEVWDMAMFGLRLGANPRAIITTTPKPVKLIRDLLAMQGKGVEVTRGSTYENRSNLARAFIERIITRYEGTRLGRQELLAELLEDVPGALWTRSQIEKLRVIVIPPLSRVVVAIDPATSNDEKSDETGIIVAGVGQDDGHGYLLADYSGRYSPTQWARKAIAAFRLWKADRIVAEVNNGGDMVESTLRSVDDAIPYRHVYATRGKAIRAEPISALYEQGRVHHVGTFAELEDQQCSFTIDYDRKVMGCSPDRMDAAVWALTELMDTKGFEGWIKYMQQDAKRARAAGEEESPRPALPRPAAETQAVEGGGDLADVYKRAFAAASGIGKQEEVCAGCGKPIGNERIDNGKAWHPQCFKHF
jgi:phage terminase large subunit-like protein